MRFLLKWGVVIAFIAVVGAAIGFATTQGEEIIGEDNFTPRWGKILVMQTSATTEQELQELTGYLRSFKIPYDVMSASDYSFSSDTLWKDKETLEYSIVVFTKTDRTTFEETPESTWDEIYRARIQGLRIVYSGMALTLDDPEYYSRVYVEKVIAWDIPQGFTFYETLFKTGNMMDAPVYQPIRVADILVEAHQPGGYSAWAYGNTYVSADNGIGIVKYYVLDKAIRDARIPVVPNMFALDNDDISGRSKFNNPPFSIRDSNRILELLERHDAYVTNAVESENIDPKMVNHLLSRQDRYINTLHESIVFAPEAETEGRYKRLMDKMIDLKLAPDYANHGVYIPPVHQIKSGDLQVLNKYGVKYVAQDIEMESIQGVIAKPVYGNLWFIGRVFVNGLHYNDAGKVKVLQEIQTNAGKPKLDWDQAMYLWLEQLNKTIWRKVPFYTHETNFAHEAPGLEIIQNYLEYLDLRIVENTTFFNLGEYHRHRLNYNLNSLIEGDTVKIFINVKKPIHNQTLYHSNFDEAILDDEAFDWSKHKKQKNIIQLPSLEAGVHTLVLKSGNKAQLGTYYMSIPADNFSKSAFSVKTWASDIKVTATKGEVSTLAKDEKGVFRGTIYAGNVSGWSTITVKDKQGNILGAGRIYLAPPDFNLKVTLPETVAAERVTLHGTVREGAEISINGRNVVNNLGSFQAEMPLAMGANYFTIVAADSEGRTKTVIKKVVRN